MGQRILLADSRFIVRSGLRSFFLHEFPHAHIKEATSPEAFVTLLAIHPYDIIVVYQAFLDKISHPSEGNIIVLISHPDKKLFLMARTYGARAYLGNDHSEHLLRAALHMKPGEILIDPAFCDWLIKLLGEENQKQYECLQWFTAREKEIADLQNQGLSYEQIAMELCIAVSTVKRHTANMKRKMKRF